MTTVRMRLAALWVLAAMAAWLPARHAAAATRARLEDALVDGDLDGEDVNAAGASALLGRGGSFRALVPASRGGAAYLSLFGFVQSSPLAASREVGAGLVVGLPFDRLGSPRLAEGSVRPLPVRASLPAPTGLVETRPATSAGGEPLALTPALARASVAAALRASGLGETDTRVDGLAARARWSSLLPETRLRATRNEDERASSESTADASKLRDSAGAGLGLEARLTWRLDRLVFAEEETALERLRLERHDARLRLTGKVLDALVRWSRASVEAREGDPMAIARVIEAEATLDVLTGGWFTAVRATRVLVLPPLPPEPEDARRTPRPPRGERAAGALDEGAGEGP